MALPDEKAATAIAGLSRRRFLVGASAVAATPLLARLAAGLLDEGDRIDLDALGLPRLSVGFVEGSGGFSGADDLSGARIVPAMAARAGEAALIGRVARVTIHGLYPSRAALPAAATTVAVNGLFASRRPDAPYPFFAWTLGAHDVDTLSHRSSFLLELDRRPRFGVAIEVAAADGSATAASVFGTGGGTNVAKLRTGTYLLGVGHAGFDRARNLPEAGATAWERLASIVLTVEPVLA